MATLQSNGAISIGNIQTVMGGPNPASLSEYYRGGTYVPSTRTVTTSEGPFYSQTYPLYYWEVIYGVAEGSPPVYYSHIQGQWNNTFVGLVGDEYTTSYTTGGYTYYKGSFMYYDGSDSSFYRISRSSTTTTNINTNVPTSGTIKLSNFYGAEKP